MGELILQTIGIVIAAASFIFGAVTIFVQVRSRRSRPRSPEALKTAVEIYNILDESDSQPQRATVKEYIDQTINQIYQTPAQEIQPIAEEERAAMEKRVEMAERAAKEERAPEEEPQPLRKFPLFNPTKLPDSLWELRWYWRAMGLVILCGFTFWTVYIVRGGFSWGAVITGYAALIGLFVGAYPRFSLRGYIAGRRSTDMPYWRILERTEALLKEGAYPQAIENYSQVIERRPDLDIALWYRAYAYERLGKRASAIRDYTDFIDITRKNKYRMQATRFLEQLKQDTTTESSQ